MAKTIMSGGGLNCNNVVQTRSGYKVEPRSTAIDPAGVSQRDVSTAFRKTPVEVGPGYSPKAMPPTGVRGTYNSSTSGPASQRTVYPSGSQSSTPAAHEMPPGRTFDEQPNKSNRP
jgi:hypothetical protein